MNIYGVILAMCLFTEFALNCQVQKHEQKKLHANFLNKIIFSTSIQFELISSVQWNIYGKILYE